MKRYDKYLITGSSGFIGFHLAKALLELGYTVIGYDNINDYYDVNLKYMRNDILDKYSKFTFYKKDICNKEELKNVVEKHNIKFIINLAAQAGVRYSLTYPEKYIESNIIGMFNVLEVCKECHVEQLMYASSSSVYGNSNEEILSIDQKTDLPISLYAATKKSNELLSHVYSDNYKINTIGMRFFTVYGPFGRPDMAYFDFAKKIYNNEEIKIFNYGNQYRDFTYIDDIVDGILKLIQLQNFKDRIGEYKIYNIGNGNPVKLMTFVETLENLIGRTAKKQFIDKQVGDVERTYADIKELTNDTSFVAKVNIEEGLKKFLDWYLSYIKKE